MGFDNQWWSSLGEKIPYKACTHNGLIVYRLTSACVLKKKVGKGKTKMF
jgi:hypothetical protein